MKRLQEALVAGLALGVIGSALAVVYAKHQSRQLFAVVQDLQAERARQEVEWGRLQLEQSTQATHTRIERVARQRLNMRQPTQSVLVAVAERGAHEDW